MARDFKHFHFHSEKIPRRRCLNQEVGLDRLDLQFETDLPKEIALRNHWDGLGVATDLAVEFAFELSDVRDVVEMPMSQEQKLGGQSVRDQPLANAIGRVEQNRPARCLKHIAIRLKNSAAEVSEGLDSGNGKKSEPSLGSLFVGRLLEQIASKLIAAV